MTQKNRPVTLTQISVLLDQKLEPIHAKLRNHDERFDEIGQRFEQIDQSFERIDEKFEQIEEKLEEIQDKLEIHDSKFEMIEKWQIKNDGYKEETGTKISRLEIRVAVLEKAA